MGLTTIYLLSGFYKISESELGVVQRFGKIIKSIVLFGSSAKETAVKDSDVDVIIIIDDCTVKWDNELVAWYREEMAELVGKNKYRKSLHVNTVRLSTWWEELIRGEPVVLNIIRYGETLIDLEKEWITFIQHNSS